MVILVNNYNENNNIAKRKVTVIKSYCSTKQFLITRLNINIFEKKPCYHLENYFDYEIKLNPTQLTRCNIFSPLPVPVLTPWSQTLSVLRPVTIKKLKQETSINELLYSTLHAAHINLFTSPITFSRKCY